MVPPGMLRRNSLWIILKGFQLIISIHWGAWNSIRHDCFYCFGLKDTMNISTKWRKFQWLVHPLRSAAIFIFTWKKCWYIKILKNDYFFRAKMFLRHEFLFKQMEIKLFCDFFFNDLKPQMYSAISEQKQFCKMSGKKHLWGFVTKMRCHSGSHSQIIKISLKTCPPLWSWKQKPLKSV